MTIRVTPRGTRGTGFPKLMRRMMSFFAPLQVAMVRRSGGAMKVQGRPLLIREPTGARTVKQRLTTLGWFPDEDASRRSWLVVASNAGAASHPAWYLNLARDPDCAIEVGHERVRVRAESLVGEERERAWKRVVELAPGYGHYATDTDREIPIVRLVPRS